MDLTSLVVAHQLSANQPRFDPAAIDRALLRRDAGRARIEALWHRCRAGPGRWSTTQAPASPIATGNRVT